MKYQWLLVVVVMFTFIKCYRCSECPVAITGGLLCQAVCKRIEENPPDEYKFTNISCTRVDQGYQKNLTVTKLGLVTVRNEKGGRLESKKTEENDYRRMDRSEGKQLRITKVFRRIISSVSGCCLTQNENKPSLETDILEKGYVRVDAGMNVTYIKRYDIKKTWDQALNICRSDYGRLVKIDSISMAKYIEKNMTKLEDVFKMNYMWIGLRDFNATNTYEWIDGTTLNFTDWSKGQPKYKDTVAGSVIDVDCVKLVRHFTKGCHWCDDYCGLKYEFICEVDVNSLQMK